MQIDCAELVVNTGFSPNGDNVNDLFTIDGIDSFPNNNVCVFNRWGNRVFIMDGYTNANGWDGTWEGNHLPDGTYFYVIRDGEGTTLSGWVEIFR